MTRCHARTDETGPTAWTTCRTIGIREGRIPNMEDRTAELTDRTVNFATALAARARTTDPLDGTGATRGVNAAYAHMSRTMTELGIHIPQEAPLPQPGPGEYAATAENLYHDLIAGRPSAGSTDGHVLIRLAQAINRAWAELTLANGTSQAFHAGDIDG